MTTFNGKLPYRGLPGVRRRERGLTLIELMISITLGLLILAGMVTVFANTSFVRSEIERTSRQIENGRYAIELLKEDIQLAGYFGESSISAVALPAVAAPPGQPDPCSIVPADWKGAMPLHVQGIDNYDSGALPDPAMGCLPGIKNGTDVIVIRRVKTCVFGAAGCDTNVNYPAMQIPLCNTEVATHTLDVRSATFAHMQKDCATASVVRPYVVYFYYVRTNNDDNVNCPCTLSRARFLGDQNDPVTGTKFEVTALVDGIESLQFDYGVDTDGDGDADSYQARPATVDDWSSVMTVQINLLAQNVEISPSYKDTKTYNLGPSKGSVGPFNDGRRRHVYSALVRIQNASGRRETP